jgi:hypothetical protein
MIDHPEKVSRIQFPQQRWQYLILFQSVAQFCSWIGSVAVGGLLLMLLIPMLGGDRADVGELAPSVVIGSLGLLIPMLRTRFTFSNSATALAMLAERLAWLGYVEVAAAGPGRKFRQNLPRILRWDEGEVLVALSGERVVVEGPQCILRVLRKSIAGSPQLWR